MAGRLLTRIWNAAVTPLVHEAGPRLTDFFRTVAEFIAFMVVGLSILAVAYFVSGDVPANLLRLSVMLLALLPALFGFLVVGDMVRMTYMKPVETVYPMVEAFEDREPM